MVRPILIPKLHLINQPLIHIKRGLDSMLFTSFWCPKRISTSGNIDTSQVQEIGTETIYRINYNDHHNGRQEQASTAWIEL